MSTQPIDSWLNPESDFATIPDPVQVGLDELAPLSSEILGEALVSQRLITAGAAGLGLLPDATGNGDLDRWGHSLSSAVGVLLPSPQDGTSPTDKRKRRRYREQLLTDQEKWPDLASISNTAFLLCADSLPPEVGLPKQLYPDGTSKGLAEFQAFSSLLPKLIRTVSPTHAPAWTDGRIGLMDALTTIVAETFKNTHDHARHHVDRSDVAHSLRGIYARFYSLAEVESLAHGRKPEHQSPALLFARSFLNKTRAPGVRQPQSIPVNGVLELSVFDSGPGMAAKWLGKSVSDVSAEEQLEALLNCFAKGRSTTGTLGRGFGLAKVLLRLRDLRGFIGVRTNSVHVYRQFSTAPGVGHKELSDGTRLPEERMYDWKRQISFIPTSRQPLRGTVVSFLLPMEGL